MKTLLTKFRLSNALDEKAGALPPPLQAKVDASPELRDFARQTAALGQALRRPPAGPAAEESLHRSIMCAVRAHDGEARPRRAPMGFALAAAFAAVALIGIWLAMRAPLADGSRAPSEAEKKAVEQFVVDFSGQISHPEALAVVAPLSNELASVDHDIRDTTRFILASLP